MPIAVKIVACRSRDADRVLRRQERPLRRPSRRRGSPSSCRRRTAAPTHEPGEVPVQAVVVHLLAARRSWPATGPWPLLPGTPSIIMSRLNSLARIDQRAVEQAALLPGRGSAARSAGRSPSSCRSSGRVAVLVRVPVQERHVLGRHLDEPGPGLDQPPGQQAAEAEAAGVVLLEALLRLLATGRTRRAPCELSSRWAFSIERSIDSLLVVARAARRAGCCLSSSLNCLWRLSNRSGVIPFGGRTGVGGVVRETAG